MKETEELFRLCHVCGFVNAAEKEVLRCGKCGKTYKPLSSLEKVLMAAGAGAMPALSEMPYSVIRGLMVFW